ncbi:MAG: TIGR01777 family protein [Chitinophagaceae bacterium]|nr:MAG: TIGR01777 family protein [Chitinophagaceae bacterium]
MKYQKIVIAGGTGYLGTVLARPFRFTCRRLVILTREAHADTDNIRFVQWDGKSPGDWCRELYDADAIINLCGKEVDCRYTAENRARLHASRLLPTRALAQAVADCSVPPRVWLNASSATIYRHADDGAQQEDNGAIGTGFSVELCCDWEEAFFRTETAATRKIALRTSFVLGRGDGAFKKLRALVTAGLGGRQGSGRQMVSWIHEQDFAWAVEWLIANPHAEGAFNVTAPNPVRNAEMMRTIRNACGIPLGIAAPAWLLRWAARIIGTEPELMLKSRWVLPQKLTSGGFRFYYETLEHAVQDLVATRV